MDNDSPLLAAVIADPWQDQPRLAFADDIGRRGEEQRGEFVRLQIGLTSGMYPGLEQRPAGNGMEQVAYRMRWLEVQERESNLRLSGAPAWAAPVSALAGGWQFERGFIWRASLTAEAFLAHGAELLSLAPITHVELTSVKPVLEKLLESPLLLRVQSLSLAGNELNDEDAMRLATSTNLAHIWWLDLSQNPIGQTGLRAIIRWPGLAGLWYLGLNGNPFDPRETFGHEGAVISDARLPEAGQALEAEFGPIRWLHYYPELGQDYPPSPNQPPPRIRI